MNTPDTYAPATELDAVNDKVQRILAHHSAARLDEAKAMLDPLLEQYPGHPRLMHLEALNMALRGNTQEAMTQMKFICDAVPQEAIVRVDYASLLAQSGQLEPAIEALEIAVDLMPNHALAHANLGAALTLQNMHAQAIYHLERAIELDSSLLDAHLNLAQAGIRSGQFQRAIDALFRALAINPQSPHIHINLAQALFRRERHETAEHHARRAIELAPDSGEAWAHLGNILASAGRIEEGSAALRKASTMPHTGLSALARLVHLHKTTPDSPELEQLREYETRFSDMPADAQMMAAFAVAKAAEDLGDIPKAFDYYKTGNRLTREAFPFDRDLMIARSERLRELVDADFVARHSGAGLRSAAPIFVCGLPRSGTTLMELMLSRHSDVLGGGEMVASLHALEQTRILHEVLEETQPEDKLTRDDFTKLGEYYDSFLHREGLRSDRVVDKMPANYLYVGLLALALPKAKFLIMRRHPLDVLLSNYVQNFGRNQAFSSDFKDLAATYIQFDQMAKHWVSLFPDQVREVVYEDVVADPEGQMRQILSFLGMEWSPNVLDHTTSSRQVNTASVAQVRAPIYQSSVARWRQFGPYLKELAAELQDHLTAEELQACGLSASGPG